MQNKEIPFTLRFPSINRQIQIEVDADESFEAIAIMAQDELGFSPDKLTFSIGLGKIFNFKRPDGGYFTAAEAYLAGKGEGWRAGENAEITITPMYYGA